LYFSVATWKKLISKIVTYRERHSTDTHSKRGGSPVPGVELYDSQNGKDINIAKQLVLEGHARMINKFGDLMKSHILLLDDDKGNGNATTPVLESPPSSPSTSHQNVPELTEPNTVAAKQNLTNGNHTPTPDKVANFLDGERTSASSKTNGDRSGKHPLKNILNKSASKVSPNNKIVNNNNLNSNFSRDSLNNDVMTTSWNDIVEEDQKNKSIMTPTKQN
jgi:hypothetical protein